MESARSIGRIISSNNPKGIVSSSPGLRGTSYPGFQTRSFSTPTGLRQVSNAEPQPRWGCLSCATFPKVARSSQPWALSRNPFGIHRCDFRKANSTLPERDSIIAHPSRSFKGGTVLLGYSSFWRWPKNVQTSATGEDAGRNTRGRVRSPEPSASFRKRFSRFPVWSARTCFCRGVEGVVVTRFRKTISHS